MLSSLAMLLAVAAFPVPPSARASLVTMYPECATRYAIAAKLWNGELEMKRLQDESGWTDAAVRRLLQLDVESRAALERARSCFDRHNHTTLERAVRTDMRTNR